MSIKPSYDVLVVGGGPAGMAAALAAREQGASVLVVEREKRIGGILKQCIHDGFGLIRFGEKLSGPEYAERYIQMVKAADIRLLTSTFLSKLEQEDGVFKAVLVSSEQGVFSVAGKAVVLACGCRERTSKQVLIDGTRPAGIFTAGTAQYLVNIEGYLPCKRCIILGSGDIGLIMARRLTLEGAEVIGVYEAKPEPSGLTRNIVQCLEDYNIPLHLSHTITRVFGDDRVEAVETAKVDPNMRPIPGTEERVPCDGVILSVGLIPENEIAEMLEVVLDRSTRGPVVDDHFMTLRDGVFSCGNALHVNDLVDYVSESGKLAGTNAALYALGKNRRRSLVPVVASHEEFLYVVPQYIDKSSGNKELILYFRSRKAMNNVRIQLKLVEDIVYDKKYSHLKPPEMERVVVELPDGELQAMDRLEIIMVHA